MLVVEQRLVGEEGWSESDGREEGELLEGLRAETSMLIFLLQGHQSHECGGLGEKYCVDLESIVRTYLRLLDFQ